MANVTTATYPGRGIIWNRLVGNGATPLNIQWGTTGITGSANANVNLFGPQTESRTAGTASIITTTQLGDTFQVTGTIVCANAGKTIGEAGLFDAATPHSPTGTLAASLTASATSMTLGASLTAAIGNFYAQVANETILVTSAASATLTVARGALGTTAAIQASGSPVTMGGDGGAGGWTTGQTVNAASITASYGGNLFIHSDFAPISLNVNDSISFTFSDTLTEWFAFVIGLGAAAAAAMHLCSFLVA